MPRNNHLRGTNSTRKLKRDLPFFDIFLDHLEPSDTLTTAPLLCREWQAMGETIGGGTLATREMLDNESGFVKALKKHYTEVPGIVRIDEYGCRGYLAKVRRLERNIDVSLLTRIVTQYPQEAKCAEDPKKGIYIDGDVMVMWKKAACGYSGFAARPIRKGSAVIVYRGKRLNTHKEGDELNKYYGDVKHWSPTMLYFKGPPENFCVDGHQHDTEDRYFKKFENLAAYLNSRQHDVNLKLQYVDGKAVLYALYNIPMNQELFWDYHMSKEEAAENPYYKERAYKHLEK